MTLTSDEPLRQRYLAAMGITPWLPTRALPGACPSPRWHWQPLDPLPAVGEVKAQAPVAPATAESRVSQKPAADSARVDVRSLIGVSDLSSNPVKPVAPQEATPAPVTPSSEPAAPLMSAIPRFRLLLVRYADCLVLDDLPLDPSQPVTPQHQSLLAAILASVGLGGDVLKSHIVSWPMFAADSGHDQGADVAAMMLRNEAGFDQLPPQLPLLLLGEQAGTHLLGEQADYQGPVVRGPSLNEMLRIPARKADLWRALQPIRNR
ncbi:hypothetical protein [Motiliproteus sediminis]|uniref:hypothetical protein n=1 Tax=Motiliproteus sediminis TaxID=1468178 RepID=UPI001AEF552E|nr:hypothetical protein [Motiliproteus sediminis]